MATPAPLDIGNVQGDILEGLGKKQQTFFFFTIKAGKTPKFREHLRAVIPLITSTTEAKDFHQTIRAGKKEAAKEGKHFPMIDNSAVNISFSQKGLVALGLEDIGDDIFKNGMQADAETLGDKLEEWDADFKKDIHGLILITANCKHILDQTTDRIKKIFCVGSPDATIQEITHLEGQVRPGAESGHEHFGFNDGLSQPAVKDVNAGVISEPGVDPVRQGIILLGREGDAVQRPSWALDGSFLVFRYLKQLVPEFDAFLEANALKVPMFKGPGDPTGAELLGARLVGRWKSGAPVDLTPLRDDPALARNQDFHFDPNSQERCPFAAHIRKTNPRSDLSAAALEPRRIIRRGIAFGPEVTKEEKKAKRSSNDEKLERGLLFVCYQSNLSNGFHFMQQSWANNQNFPPKSTVMPPVPTPGIDPIIGVGKDTPRQMVGTNPDPNLATQILEFTARWVIPRGGEYFFTPSIPALTNTFAAPAPRPREL